MALTKEEYIALIESECLEASSADTDTLLQLWWNRYSSLYTTATIDSIYLYVKRACLRYVLKQARALVDITTGQDRVAASQKVKNILGELAQVESDITSAASSASNRAYSTVPSSTLSRPEPTEVYISDGSKPVSIS